MTFKELSRIIRKRSSSSFSSDQPLTPDQLEIEESKALLQQLQENHIKAYNLRKEKWFGAHPEEKYFTPTYEDIVKDCTLNEWFWYLYQYLKQTPERRYQEQKQCPLEHDGSWYMRNLERDDGKGCGSNGLGCVPECRFHPLEGRIEDLEILEYYKEYQGYDEVRKAWESITAH